MVKQHTLWSGNATIPVPFRYGQAVHGTVPYPPSPIRYGQAAYPNQSAGFHYKTKLLSSLNSSHNFCM